MLFVVLESVSIEIPVDCKFVAGYFFELVIHPFQEERDFHIWKLKVSMVLIETDILLRILLTSPYVPLPRICNFKSDNLIIDLHERTYSRKYFRHR